ISHSKTINSEAIICKNLHSIYSWLNACAHSASDFQRRALSPTKFRFFLKFIFTLHICMYVKVNIRNIHTSCALFYKNKMKDLQIFILHSANRSSVFDLIFLGLDLGVTVKREMLRYSGYFSVLLCSKFTEGLDKI